jgi:hypothetical protein
VLILKKRSFADPVRIGTNTSSTVFAYQNLIHLEQFHCLYTNVQGLRSKLEELRHMHSHCNYDLIALTETWLSSDVTDAEIKLPGMEVIRNDRANRTGGGVAIYHRSDLQFERLDIANSSTPDILCCQLKLKQMDVCKFTVVYRPPSSTLDMDSDLICTLRKHLTPKASHILLTGDFNLHNLELLASPSEFFKAEFQDLISNYPLYNHVNESTRFRVGNTPSMLDLICTNEKLMVEDLKTACPLGKSDHVTISFQFVCYTTYGDEPKHEFRMRTDGNDVQCSDYGSNLVRKTNFVQLISKLCLQDTWNIPLSTVDEHWTMFINRLQALIEENSAYVPIRKSYRPTFSLRSRTRKWITTRNIAWSRYKSLQTADNWDNYRRLRNRITIMIRDEKQQHQMYLMRCMNRNPKVLYKLVNNNAKVKPGVTALKVDTGTTCTAKETADVLAKFFASVYSPRDGMSTLHITKPSIETELSDVSFDPATITSYIHRLRNSSPGADGITPLLLRHCAHPLSYALAELFDHSLKEGNVPSAWKCGIITPIHKGGNRSNPSSYRPVTLLPVISKLMERIIVDVLKSHLQQHDILRSEQHGFRTNHSCLSNLLLTLEDWTRALDEGYCVHACYLDVAKAFDRVDHCLLLRKMQNYGISGNLLKWLTNYLDNRSVHIRVGGTLSDEVIVTSGVPQGSVLGPILFLLYMNDLPQLVRCRIIMFADDIKIWTRVSSIHDCQLLQLDLDALHDWSLRNKLPFNFQKCKMLRLGKVFDFPYRLGSHELEWTTNEKDLGVWICSSLKSSLHCQKVYRKSSMLLGMLTRLFGRFTPEALPIIMNTYIRPTMEYAVQAWSPSLQMDIELMQRIYHRATKLVTGLHSKPYEERIAALNMFDFPHRRLRGDLILTYKILHTPGHPLFSLFKPGSDRITRKHRLSLTVPPSRLNCRRYFFSVRVCFMWNALPESVVSCTSLSSFKLALDAHMRANSMNDPRH